MSNIAEKAQWEDGIYQLETSDPVMGGPDGIDNLQARQLANRTRYLRQQQDAHTDADDPHPQYAPTADPEFTGKPLAPTPATRTNNQQLATTEFAWNLLAANGVAGDAPGKGVFDLNNAAPGGILSVHGAESDAAANHWPVTRAPAATRVWYNVLTYGSATRLTQWATQSAAGNDQSRTWARHKHDDTWSAWNEVATTESVKTAGVQFGDLASISASDALGAQMAGQMVIAPANGQILTLPPASDVKRGDTISVRVIAGTADGVHIQRHGKDVLSDGLSSVPAMHVQAGSEVEFVSNGASTWYAGGTGASHAHLAGKNFYATLNAGTANRLYTPELIVNRGVYLIVPYYCGLGVTAGGDSYYLYASADFVAGHGDAHATNQPRHALQSFTWPPFILRVRSQTATIRCHVWFRGNANSTGLLTNYADNRGSFAFYGARIA